MMDDKDLDQFFASARESRPVPSTDLMARVLTDAYEAQPTPVAPARSVAPPPSGVLRMFADLAQALGGKGALAGLGTAAIAGVWLGYSGPSGLDWLTSALLSGGISDVEMIAVDDLFLSEG
jgi:hypothetical protein